MINLFTTIIVSILFITMIISILLYIFGTQILSKLSDYKKNTIDQLTDIKHFVIICKIITGLICGFYYLFSFIFIGYNIYKYKKLPSMFNIIVSVGIFLSVLLYIIILFTSNIDNIMDDISLSNDTKKSMFIENSNKLQIYGIFLFILCIFIGGIFIYFKIKNKSNNNSSVNIKPPIGPSPIGPLTTSVRKRLLQPSTSDTKMEPKKTNR